MLEFAGNEPGYVLAFRSASSNLKGLETVNRGSKNDT